MRLVAEKRLKYGNKVYQAGQTFEATVRDAQVLIAARLARQDLTPVPAGYQTREMRAN